MFTEKEVQFVRDVYQSIGREFVHEPKVSDCLDDVGSSVLDFDWFSVYRYPVTFDGIGVKKVIRYDVRLWAEYTGYDGRPEICEAEIETGLDSIQAAVVECLANDAKQEIIRQVFDVPLERTFGDI